ncbi:DUF6484 domain-containing protein [Myxococcus hansupus]|uniref:DUF6484 domain-containing protein n=1 Tax=Pseudomyxococcus hansupus TaxID=1297742 RepID=UPI000A67D128|nr:DUF6484 domain-containing protein [Myxococcus hansupus]
MKRPETVGVPVPGASETEAPLWGTYVGWVTGIDAEGHLLVDFTENPLGPLRASRTVELDSTMIREAASSRQAVVLSFDRGRRSHPIVLGLVQAPSLSPLVDAVLTQSLASVPAKARVDGREVVIEAREEMVLRCGKASITLRRNGEVLLRGVNIRTEADELHRIKGGKVQIN